MRDPGEGGSRRGPPTSEAFGIDYLAPRDARATGLDAESIDFVTSTNTLDARIPRKTGTILRECRRLLRLTGP